MSSKSLGKVCTPFGMTPTRQTPFSQMSHLRNEDIPFFQTLSSPIKSRQELESPSICGENSFLKPARKKGKDKVKIVEHCTRKKCIKIRRRVREVGDANEIEKDKIRLELEKVKKEAQLIDTKNKRLESQFKVVTDENAKLRQDVLRLDQNIDKLLNVKESLRNEKNEVENKIMVLEAEKQSLHRQINEAQKALSHATWTKTDQQPSSRSSDCSPTMTIRKTVQNESDFETLLSPSKSSYLSLANQHRMDFTELKSLLVLPSFGCHESIKRISTKSKSMSALPNTGSKSTKSLQTLKMKNCF